MVAVYIILTQGGKKYKWKSIFFVATTISDTIAKVLTNFDIYVIFMLRVTHSETLLGGNLMNRAQLKSLAKSQIKGNIGILFVIALIAGLIMSALNLIPVVGSVAVAFVASPLLAMNMVLIYLGLTKGKKPEIADLFKNFNNFWPVFKVQFLTGLFVMLWSLLLYVSGIIKGISYSQALYIISENPEMGAREAITKSRQMMDGHKMEYFVLCLSFIGWALLGSLTFGILYIWLTPYMSATFANFYNSLKANDEPVLAEAEEVAEESAEA